RPKATREAAPGGVPARRRPLGELSRGEASDPEIRASVREPRRACGWGVYLREMALWSGLLQRVGLALLERVDPAGIDLGQLFGGLLEQLRLDVVDPDGNVRRHLVDLAPELFRREMPRDARERLEAIRECRLD